MTFSIRWTDNWLGQRNRFLGIATCGGCGKPAAFMAISNNVAQPSSINSDIEAAHYVVPEFWPKPAELDIPRHVDQDLVDKLSEAERSYNANINTGAAGLYRAVVDTTTKKQLKAAGLAETGTLDARLKRLADNHIIPTSVADWGHEVRVIGNEGLHEEPVISRADAEMARSFALTYLRYAFELPGDVNARRAAKANP